MKACFLWIPVVVLLGFSCASGADIRQEPLRFPEGTSGITVTGRIEGDQIVDYQVRAAAGQSMLAIFRPSNLSAYFNVLPPGSEEALFVGSISGNRFEAALPAEGVTTIRVYLMRNAARRHETATYSLEVEMRDGGEAIPEGAGSPSTGTVFDRTLELQNVRFQVTCTREGSISTLRIASAGLEIDNSPIVRTISGSVTGAEVADLDADGSPEIYVYVRSAGSGSYGSLVGYAANRRRSLSEIYLPPLEEDPAAAAGYMGHDEFAVVESVLARRFPVHLDTDIDARPTGGMRQIQYKLVPGEAGWILKVDKAVEF